MPRYVRTQVQVTPEQLASLRRRAQQRGTSVAALLREAIEAATAGDAQEIAWERALAAVGKYSSGTANTSVDHDDAFVESILG